MKREKLSTSTSLRFQLISTRAL